MTNLCKKNAIHIFFSTLIAFYSILLSFPYTSLSSSLDAIENAQKSMVTIKTNIPVAVHYTFLRNSWKSTGTVINKQKGIILTAFPFGARIISSYRVRFFNGSESRAKLLYKDPWIEGISLIKVDPSTIPQDVSEIHFAQSSMAMNQEVFTLDSDDNDNFVVKNGIVSDLHHISGGTMSCQFITLSMGMPMSSNVAPILDARGRFVGLKCQGASTYAMALHPNYIKYIMASIEVNTKPTRKHIGVITSMYSLGQAHKTRSFPKKELIIYAKKFKDSRLQAIEVISTLKGSPAENILQNGDIIWSVDNKEVGPSLIDFDMAMNNSKKDVIKVAVLRSFREGEKVIWRKMEFDIKLYNLSTNSIKSIIRFGRYLLFEADELLAHEFSIPLKALVLKESAFGLSYSSGEYVLMSNIIYVKAVNGRAVKSISDFLQLIPDLKKKKNLLIRGHVYDRPASYSENIKMNMSLDDDCIFKHHVFDSKSMAWTANEV